MATCEYSVPNEMPSYFELKDIPGFVRSIAPNHRTTGNWTLAQVCQHLAATLNASIDGMDLSNHRWKRRLLGGLLFRYTMRAGIPRNYTVDPRLTPPPNVVLEEAISALEAAVNRYVAYQGTLQSHPLFGRLRRADWDRMHHLHAAHHLGFVVAGD